MTYPDLLTTEELKPVGKKAEIWKNRWLFRETGTAYCAVCKKLVLVEAGEEVLTHCQSFSSKEEAVNSGIHTKVPYIAYIGPLRIS